MTSTGLGYRLGVMVPSTPDHRIGWPPSSQDVVAAQNGDHGQLTVIMASGIPKLVGFYRGLGLRFHDAEDLASDTCEAMVRSLSQVTRPGEIRAMVLEGRPLPSSTTTSAESSATNPRRNERKCTTTPQTSW